MAGTLMRYGDKPNTNLCEFCVDTVDEIDYLPTTTTRGSGVFEDFDFTAPMGSTATVGNGDSEVLVYMLFTNGWKKM